MSGLIVSNDFCSQCGVAGLAADNYCSNCGQPTVVPVHPIVAAELVDSQSELAVSPRCQSLMAPPRRQTLVTEVLGNRLFVIGILLCAGPIGLLALWFSHRFSRRSKIITTAGYLILTVVLPLAITWYFLEVAIHPIVDTLG